MAFILSADAEAKIRYSKSEKLLFECLAKAQQPVTTLELVAGIYRQRRPINARQSVLTIAKSLMMKVDKNKEAFRILRSEQIGPRPISFWIEPKKAKQ